VAHSIAFCAIEWGQDAAVASPNLSGFRVFSPQRPPLKIHTDQYLRQGQNLLGLPEAANQVAEPDLGSGRLGGEHGCELGGGTYRGVVESIDHVAGLEACLIGQAGGRDLNNFGAVFRDGSVGVAQANSRSFGCVRLAPHCASG